MTRPLPMTDNPAGFALDKLRSNPANPANRPNQPTPLRERPDGKANRPAGMLGDGGPASQQAFPHICNKIQHTMRGYRPLLRGYSGIISNNPAASNPWAARESAVCGVMRGYSGAYARTRARAHTHAHTHGRLLDNPANPADHPSAHGPQDFAPAGLSKNNPANPGITPQTLGPAAGAENRPAQRFVRRTSLRTNPANPQGRGDL